MSAPHGLAVRVYYEDTDFSGNVYHAAFLKFMERGRTEFLRSFGVHHAELARAGVAFAVTRIEIDFLRPAHIDDLLEVSTSMVSASGARLVLDQAITRAGTLLARARLTVVAIRGERPTRLPRPILEALAHTG